jgi:hypothetical protein
LIAKPEAGAHLNHGMDVIRHHAPSEQEVALTIEMQQRIFDLGRDLRALEPAGPGPLVQACIERKRSFRRARAARNKVPREAIGKTEDNGLNDFGRVKVREISARMPSGRRIVHALSMPDSASRFQDTGVDAALSRDRAAPAAPFASAKEEGRAWRRAVPGLALSTGCTSESQRKSAPGGARSHRVRGAAANFEISLL